MKMVSVMQRIVIVQRLEDMDFANLMQLLNSKSVGINEGRCVIVSNRFNNMDLIQVVSDGWFGDDIIEEISDWSEDEYTDYINDLPRIFPEANLTQEEIQYLLKLK